MKDKVCTDCALLRYNNGTCPYFQESFTSEDRACPKFISSLVKCDVCGKNLCTGDHSDCGEPVINYCNICGKNFEIGEHGILGCGHYACEDGDHNQCPYCPGYICTGDHNYRECGHPVCVI